MSRNFVAVFVLLASLSALGFAQTYRSSFTVPFAFQFDSKLMPAGQYQLVFDSTLAFLQRLDKPEFGAISYAPMNRPASDPVKEFHLHFVVFEGKYFLHQMEADYHAAHLRVPVRADVNVASADRIVTLVTLVTD